MSLFRSKSAQPKTTLHIDAGAHIEFLERGPMDNWSTGDAFSNAAPGKAPAPERSELRPRRGTSANPRSRPLARLARMSLQHLPYAHHQARRSLVAEAPPPRPGKGERAQRTPYAQSEQGEKRRSQYGQEEENPPAQMASGLPERSAANPDVFAPIRRRSFLQHGIATRQSWAEGDARQSLPSQLPSQWLTPAAQDSSRNHDYNPTEPPSLPLPSLAALRSKHGDISDGRTMTPNDLEYRHTGAFKLGSLRITNGAASPVSTLDMSVTGWEDSSVDNRGSPRRPAPRRRTISVPQEMVNPPESPVRQAHKPDEPLRVITYLPLPEFTAFSFDMESPTKSLDLAREYVEDVATSPFSFVNSPPRTPRLEATSKNTAVEDGLLEAEEDDPKMEELHHSRSFDSGYRAEETKVRTAKKAGGEPAPKPLAKADSGYSSNMSLRSFKGQSVPAVPAKDSCSRVPSSAYSETSSYSQTSEVTMKKQSSLPALPKQTVPPPLTQTPSVPRKIPSAQNSGKIIFPPRMLHESPQRVAASSTPHRLRKDTNAGRKSLPAASPSLQREFRSSHSRSGSNDSRSLGETSRWRRDKKRPQSLQPQPVYTVQASRSASDELSIPPGPADKSRHLKERTGSFPAAPFPNRVFCTTQLRRTVSKETLGTIFSVGSAEYRAEVGFARLQSALPPIPAQATVPEVPVPKPEVHRHQTLQSSTPVPVPVSERRNRQSAPREVAGAHQPTSREATPIQQQPQGAFEDHVTSCENVSSSIGKSPYDIALGAVRKNLPTAHDRAKSMTSRPEVEARARFARARSVSQESLISRTTAQRRNFSESMPQEKFLPPLPTSSLTRGKPPPAHAKWSGLGGRSNSPGPAPFFAPQRSDPNLAEYGRLLPLSSAHRLTSSPSVEVQEQHIPLPVHNESHIVSQYMPPAPAHNLPASPPPSSPVLQPETQDPWTSEKRYWAERRKSADRALRMRNSMEMRRPESRASGDGQLKPQILKRYGSWDTNQHWDGYPQTREQEYDHTYGSYPQSFDHDKDNWSQNHQYCSDPSQSYQAQSRYHQEEYYEGPTSDPEDYFEEQLPQVIHQRQTSTSEMLVLDRFSGGLGYGYEPGVGLGGSAGPRNTGRVAMAGGGRKSVDVSMRFGVDFSDVPVFLQRVPFNV